MVLIRRYKQKKLISKISVDSNFMFSSYAWLCVFHCSHRLLCWINSRVREFSVKLLLFHTEMLPAKFLWGSVLLRGELQKYAKKFKLWKISIAPSIWNNGEFAFNMLSGTWDTLFSVHLTLCTTFACTVANYGVCKRFGSQWVGWRIKLLFWNQAKYNLTMAFIDECLDTKGIVL